MEEIDNLTQLYVVRVFIALNVRPPTSQNSNKSGCRSGPWSAGQKGERDKKRPRSVTNCEVKFENNYKRKRKENAHFIKGGDTERKKEREKKEKGGGGKQRQVGKCDAQHLLTYIRSWQSHLHSPGLGASCTLEWELYVGDWGGN